MQRWFIKGVLAALLLPAAAWPLGLGELRLESTLNQPFSARIELVAATAAELDSLKINLADVDAFRRAGIDRLFMLSTLRFEIVREEAGADYIRVSTIQPLREPFLNFLLEAGWSTGRLFREYTVLLDPPLYDPNARRRTTPAPISDETDGSDVPAVSPATSPGPVVGPAVGAASGRFSGTEYGPIVTGDTLWSIASQIRPDGSVSVQQMMLALLRANPEAFIDNNINGLKRGQVLTVPAIAEVSSIPAADAFAEARRQNAAWQEAYTLIAADVPARVESAAPAGLAGDTGRAADDAVFEQPASTDDPELRLVAAADDTNRVGGQGASQAGGVNPQELVIANEQVISLSAENTELKERLSEAEDIIQNLERLLELKDDDLARMQDELSGAAAAAAEQAEAEAAAPIGGELAPDGEGLAEDAPAEDGAEPFVDEAGDGELDAVEEEVIEEQPIDEVIEEEFLDEETLDEEIIEEEAIAEEQPAPPIEDTPAPPPEKSMLGQIMDIVMAYLAFIVGGIVAIIALVGAALFIKKKKAAMAEEQAFQYDFTGYEAAAAATGADPGDATAIVPPPGGDAKADARAADIEAPAEDETPPAQAPAEDPLAEVNVFLAYEYFDQAEEFVRDAITGDPDNLNFHTKLLEVFYAAGDKKSYEEAAKVLHDKVGGAGSHWDMAVAMWQEISPNRALFDAPLAGEDEAEAQQSASGGGVVNLTADGAAEKADMPMDFDIGGDSGPAADEAADVGMLDLTGDADTDTLDMPAAEPAATDDLDITPAAGLEMEGLDASLGAADDAPEDSTLDRPLDFMPSAEPEAAAGLDMDATDVGEVLDIAAAESPEADDGYDLTADLADAAADIAGDAADGTADISAGDSDEDLLDTTSKMGPADEPGSDEDLLDSTAAGQSEAYDEQQAADEDNGLDFDISGLSVDEPGLDEPGLEEAAVDDVALEVEEAEGVEVGEVEVEEAAAEDNGLDFDISGLSVDEPGLEETTGDDVGPAMGETSDTDIDMGADTPDDLSVDLDFSVGEAEEEEAPDPEPEAETEAAFELDIAMDDGAEAVADEIDMDGTVRMPAPELALDDEDEDEPPTVTVFVPRAGETEKQTEEEELTTKLDLAKAYVELGDADSARSIIDEVLADGNAEQQQQAKDLLAQI